MSILIIRTHKRFAVRQPAQLQNSAEQRNKALLIELSLQGCRLSGIADDALRTGELAMLHIDGCDALQGHVSWTRADVTGGMAGLRFIRPLLFAELDRLVRVCRGELEIISPQAQAPMLRIVAS